MIKSFPTLALVLTCLSGLCASAQEKPDKPTPLKKTRVVYKYHTRIGDSEDAKDFFPKNGHSVQIGHDFWHSAGGYFSFVVDYTHLPKHQDPHLLSAGFDLVAYPGKMFADLFGRSYTPRTERWTINWGYYKTLDKYRVNYVTNFGLSYRIPVGGVVLVPVASLSQFDEAAFFSRIKADEQNMRFASFGLSLRF